MATNRSFDNMLNEYLTEELFRNELLDRDMLLKKCKKDENWRGGTYPVPFYGGASSSMSFGSLTDAADISEDTTVRGQITTQPELWGSLLFNEKDWMQHKGSKREQSFLNKIEDIVPEFVTWAKTALSIVLTSGPHFATLTDDGTSGGLITVDKPELFTLKQKVIVRNTTPANVVGYVQAINMETGVVHLQTTRAGGSDRDCSAMTTALDARCYFDGLINTSSSAIENEFTSLRSVLLSSANGGGANLYGQTKATYPFLQSINANGADITAANILEKLFALYSTEIGRKAKFKKTGKSPNEFLLSDKNFAAVMIAMQHLASQYYVKPKSKEADAYDFKSITIGSNQGVELTFSCLPEIGDDIIPCVNWDTIKFASNGFFKFREHPNQPGKIGYHETRATTGYTYIVDVACMGDLVVNPPCANGIIHGVNISL